MSSSPSVEAVKHTEYAAEFDVPFHKIKHLGRGAYGVVDKVQRGSEIYARKTFTVYKHQKRRMLKEIAHEIRLISSIKHVHIVSLVETYTCGLEYAMIMEPVADGDLAEFLHDLADGSASLDLRNLIPGWFGCLLAGLAYLHDRHIHHRDIKPQNLLHYGERVLFIDFGIAREFTEETFSTQTSETGTKYYWAPESGNKRRPGRKADIFSLGLVFLELLAILSDSESFFTLQSLRPYYTHSDEVDAWITRIDMTPIKAEWYPAMIFVCRNMLQHSKESRAYASDLTACWEYQPFTVVPPTSCSCIASSVVQNVEGMQDARQRARSSGHQLALELMLRRGPSTHWKSEIIRKPQKLSLSDISTISSMPYDPILITHSNDTDRDNGINAVIGATGQEAHLEIVLNKITLRNPIKLENSWERLGDSWSEQTHPYPGCFRLDLPFPLSLFGHFSKEAYISENGIFCLDYGMSSRLFQ